MAPPRRFESPHRQLMRLLVEARVEGLRFEAAWERAMRPGQPLVMTNAEEPPAGAVLWPTDSRDRLAWQGALRGLKDQIRRAYQMRPATPSERAVVILVDTLNRRETDGMDRQPAVRSAA